MSVRKELESRSGGVCELCGSNKDLTVLEVSPSDGSAEQSILVCSTCKPQIEDSSTMDETHWNCLNDSMWSEVPAVKVVSFRLLNRLERQDLLDMMYLEDDTKKWAAATGEGLSDDEKIIHKDSNGTILLAGDSVTLIKDLEVKGAGFTAKRGTLVKNISLTDNPEQIEGRVNGTQLVLLTKFMKKAS